jgi:predicted ATPase
LPIPGSPPEQHDAPAPAERGVEGGAQLLDLALAIDEGDGRYQRPSMGFGIGIFGPRAVIAYATEHGLPFWMASGLALRGWALVERGELERGMADLEQGLGSLNATGASLGRSPHLANLAAARARAGRLAEARELLDQCKALVTATSERYQESEIHRLDAELVLAEAGGAGGVPSDARERAEARLHTAIECARRQGARTLELRAATALARLCGRGAKGRQARARLADLLAGFTEGFDTPDLQEARRLVAEAPRTPTSTKSVVRGS